MSRKDFFARYSKLYLKQRTREIVPEGAFVRQLSDLPKKEISLGLFLKAKRTKEPRQIYINEPIPFEVGEEEGFLETENSTFLSRTLLNDFKTIKYLRLVIGVDDLLERRDERIQFLKKCRRIVDITVRKANNTIHTGEFGAFRFDKRIYTLDDLLTKKMKLDEVASEAAAIPFNIASPEYVLLTNGDIVVIDTEYAVPHATFFFVGGIGYTFDKKVGAVNEERLFRGTSDHSVAGIDDAYIEGAISRVTEDFQTQLHSLMFSDMWKKGKSQPIGVNFDNEILIKISPDSDMWAGVFEVYVVPPK